MATPACRVALEWLSSLLPLAVDDAIAGMAQQLVPQLPVPWALP